MIFSCFLKYVWGNCSCPLNTLFSHKMDVGQCLNHTIIWFARFMFKGTLVSIKKKLKLMLGVAGVPMSLAGKVS